MAVHARRCAEGGPTPDEPRRAEGGPTPDERERLERAIPGALRRPAA